MGGGWDVRRAWWSGAGRCCLSGGLRCKFIGMAGVDEGENFSLLAFAREDGSEEI